MGGFGGPAVRRITVADYVDRMKAGWVGQMAGVGWGGPTEFKYKGIIMAEEKMPEWRPEKINQFSQDDIYVEMTFLRTLEQYGLDCSLRQAGIDFANSGYKLWHANRNGRDNLRKGIAPPDSGHPKFNKHADDIDYQIEADYSALRHSLKMIWKKSCVPPSNPFPKTANMPSAYEMFSHGISRIPTIGRKHGSL
ncbi:MAG: hypothetical protein ACYSWZ_12335 [Planctomycetota bacterium]